MPRRPTRTVPTVIVHGWRGPGPAPWQDWLAAQLADAGREVRYPQLPDPQTPTLAAWLAALRETLAGLPDTQFDVVAHSLGAVLWLHHVAEPDGSPRPARVALVAPSSAAAGVAEIAEFFPVPLDVDIVRHAAEGTVLVGADDDPYAPEGVAAAYGQPLKMATTVLPGGGHVNGQSGYTEWPAMLSWCNRDNLAFY
jgi:predicted alpha/beta hydrolase family esterase